MNDGVDVIIARRRLAALWLGGAAIIGLLLFAQTVTGKFGGQVERAWGWFLPTVIPTLTVIVTAWFDSSDGSTKQVSGGAFRMALGLSAVYLIAVAATLLAQPLSAQPPLEFITSSNLWLAPVQGLAGIGIGRFFTSQSPA